MAQIPDTADWRARGTTKCTGEMHPPQLRGSARPPMPLNRDVCAFDFRFEASLNPSTTHYRPDLPSTRPRSVRQYYREWRYYESRLRRNEYARRSRNHQRASTLFIRRIYRLHAYHAPNRYSIIRLKNNHLITLATMLGKFRLPSSIFRLLLLQR